MDVINDQSPLSQKRIEVTEIKEWVYTMLPTLVDQPTLLYARAEQSTINGNHFVRIPTTGKGSDGGSFYFKRRPDGSMEVNYVVRLVSDSIKGNGIVGFANLDEKTFRVNVYENNKLVLSKIVPDSLGLFNKAFLSSATQIKKFDAGCEVDETTRITLPDGSDSVVIVKRLGGGGPKCGNQSDDFWFQVNEFFKFKWLKNLFSGGGGGSGGSGNGGNNSWDPNSVDYWSYWFGFFNYGINGSGGLQNGPSNTWGPFTIPWGMFGVTERIPVFDPNNPWDDIDNYYEFPEIPIIENGISISDNVGPLNNPKKIGFYDRKNRLDMEHGTSGNLSILGGYRVMDYSSDWVLFTTMRTLLLATTFPPGSRQYLYELLPLTPISVTDAFIKFPNLDWSLSKVGQAMVDRFESRTGWDFKSEELNQKVLESHGFINFIKNYGIALSGALRAVGGKIDLVDNFNVVGIHPAFNTAYDKFHGLMILINDTESGEILGDNFTIDAQGNWSIDLSITITDHFGIDDNDVITYKGENPGFPAWWILQKRRDYVPFKTVIKIKKHIWGNMYK